MTSLALCKTASPATPGTVSNRDGPTMTVDSQDGIIERHEGHCTGRFTAMASPCEVLVDGEDPAVAAEALAIVVAEVRRIEHKFSRYRDDSVVAQIHAANGAPVPVDAETARLLDYAETCWQLSDGRFDITSGVLRRAWTFDGSDRLPERAQVEALLPRVGWRKVQRESRNDGQTLRLPAGMEIDFGGIGKEYAVDRALLLASNAVDRALLVNLGGDLATNGALHRHREWSVGIEAPGGGVAKVLHISAGAMATSGDARRFLLKEGVRYGHILDPHTGWPVPGAPRSVTVVARSCIEAGTLSTLAMLQGDAAEKFLDEQQVQYWVLR